MRKDFWKLIVFTHQSYETGDCQSVLSSPFSELMSDSFNVKRYLLGDLKNRRWGGAISYQLVKISGIWRKHWLHSNEALLEVCIARWLRPDYAGRVVAFLWIVLTKPHFCSKIRQLCEAYVECISSFLFYYFIPL